MQIRLIALWLVWAAVAPAALAQVAAAQDASTFLIVTRPDVRRCAYPLCGGYFVKRVNQAFTRCADGSVQRECHVVDFDFDATGLDPQEAERFENEAFGPGHGLVRGSLEQRDVGAAFPADTLVVTEAWEGQAKSEPRGAFFRLSSTGIVCITFPCPSYLGERLNTALQRSFNAIDLAASGAAPEAVERGYAALAENAVLGAGRAVPVRGPAGLGFDFVTSEFYLRLSPREDCAPLDATGVGPCDQFFGYAWDGAECTSVSGCSCDGADCDALHESLEACQTAMAGCER